MDIRDERLPLANAAQGDDEAYAIVADRMQPLIRHCIQSYAAAGLDTDDLQQEASLGLLAAVRAYRPDGGAAFTTFATTCIRNRLASFARRHNAPVPEPLEEDETADADSDPERRMLEREAFSRLQEQLRERLTELEYRVLIARLSDLTYDEIATRLGVSKKTVDNAVQRLRRKMQ